jgi:quinol monooxygenase YgiN
MGQEVIVLGRATATDGNLESMLRLSVEHVVRSRSEHGCLSHEVTQSVEDENTLRFVERWADLPALKAHFALPATSAFSDDVVRLSGGAVALAAYAVDEVPLR